MTKGLLLDANNDSIGTYEKREENGRLYVEVYTPPQMGQAKGNKLKIGPVDEATLKVALVAQYGKGVHLSEE